MLSGESGEQLRRHVEQGGGLIMVLGENSIGEWPGILPSNPPIVDRSSTGGMAIGYVDTGHPIFEPFAGPRTGDFGAARVYRYRSVPSGSFPRVLARYGDGGAALSERPVGDGRLLVWGSTLDGSWNDLILQPIFLPFLQQMIKYAAGYNPPRNWLTIGDPFDLHSMLPIGGEYSVALTPSGDQVALEAEVPLELTEVGFYELRDPRADGGSVVLAVNVDPAEADLMGFDPEEMRNALIAASEGNASLRSDGGLTLVERERQQSGWWVCIIAVFLLLAAETFFSNRRRPPAKEGRIRLRRRNEGSKDNPKVVA